MSKNVTPEGGEGKPNAPATVTRRFNDVAIGQRLDGYLNATAMCKAAGREWKAYNRLDGTAEFLAALSGSVKIPTDLLVTTITTGPNAGRGTWVHPQIGYHLAQWCSPAFAVQVTEWILEIATKGYATAPGVEIDTEAVRRIDGISRMVSHKVTGTEKMVKLIADAVERQDGRIEHMEIRLIALAQATKDLMLLADAHGKATVEYISVRQLLEEAGALPKGRNSLNRRIGNALRDLALTRQPPVALRRCLHSGVWLIPIDFAHDFMKATGSAWVQDHNAKVAGQGVLKFPTRRRKPTDDNNQPGAGA